MENSSCVERLSLPARLDSEIKSFLLIDDDPLMEKLAYCYLKQAQSSASFYIKHASNLIDAMKALNDQNFDHVLLDNCLPPHLNISETVPELEPLLGDARLTVISAVTDDPSFFGGRMTRVDEIVDKSDFKNWALSEALPMAVPAHG